MKKLLLASLVLVAAAACSSDVSSPPGLVTGGGASAPVYAKAGGIQDSYIVVFKDGVSDQDNAEGEMIGQNGGELKYSYRHALNGFAARLSPAAVARIAQDPRVKYVEQDQPMHAITTQSGATWGIDRIDQRALPLSGTYTYNADGTGVTVYIIDTGILLTHAEFAGRAVKGYDAVTVGGTAVDCNGHGTHVSGTVGGTTYGVAKKVSLVAVRVLDCSGSGSTSGVVAGIDWVTANKKLPAAANMSLGGGASQPLDDAVARSTTAGVVYAIAAGNDGLDACNYSPARAPSAITVGATDNTDTKASWSNFGTCVDIFGPGVNITSSWYSPGTTATNTISGTSMATPHVAGAAALYLQTNPTATVAQVTTALTSNATTGVVKSPGTGSPNLLLYTANFTAAPQPPVADFSFSCTQLACNFDGSLSSAQATATYTWVWGDLTASGSGKTASHSYAASGTFSVTLTVTDAIGTSSKTKPVTVSNTAPPPAAATANFTASCPTMTCSFTNTSTGVAAGASHVWQWGDGTTTTVTTTASQNHTYTTVGNKTVILTVTNPGAAASSVSKVVTPRNCVGGNGDC